MTYHKLIFTGPVGAGKTTAIAAISDRPPVTTDVLASDETADVKPTTTVAMDYGVLELGAGERVHLYGTPGQERFDFMWEILAEGAIGVVLLITNTRPEPLADLDLFVRAFRPLIDRSQLAVGITGLDVRHRPPLPDYHRALAGYGLNPPLFEVDARRPRDVSLLVQALLLAVDPALAPAAARTGTTDVPQPQPQPQPQPDVEVRPGDPPVVLFGRDYW